MVQELIYLKDKQVLNAHYVGITPDQKYLYSIDLGADKIVMYDFKDGKLEETSLSQAVNPGSGPRHMIFLMMENTVISSMKLVTVLWFTNIMMDTLLWFKLFIVYLVISMAFQVLPLFI